MTPGSTPPTPIIKFNILEVFSNIFNFVSSLIDSLKVLVVSCIKFVFPLFALLVLIEILFKTNLGVLNKILSVLSTVGVKGDMLTVILLLIFGSYFFTLKK